MSSEETVITVTLLAGELSGIRIAELPFADLQAILIPRNRLHYAKDYTLERLGVYLLLEAGLEKPRVYIGQTGDVWERLNHHDHKPALHWKTAIALVSKSALGLTFGHIKWLELRNPDG